MPLVVSVRAAALGAMPQGSVHTAAFERSRWRGGRSACDTSRVMDRPADSKPHLFAVAQVPWWSYVLFFVVVGLVIWFSDDFVRPAF